MLSINAKRVFISLFSLLNISVHAQDLQQNLDFFSARFMTAIKSQDRPQAYLVTDKSIYTTGETIWFRAFLLNALSQKVNSRSKFLFVDLVNEKDSVISLVLLYAASQQTNGQIMLPANITSGSYWLRAYTRQMAEGDTNNCYVKPLYIVGKSHERSLGTRNSEVAGTVPAIKFYPEGGAIITGAKTTVAFLIQDIVKRPIVTEGVIKDNRDSIVAHFNSNKSGLGKFDFSPTAFRKYKAYINWNGKEFSYPLPPFNFKAGQIAITKPSPGSLTLRVLLEDSIYTKDFVSYVIGVSKDSLCFAGIGRGLYELAVPEQNFPAGIATFYLFDNNMKYLSERSVYIKQHNLVVKASLNKTLYGKRDKVILDIAVTDAGNKPVPALFSVAVTDSAFLDPVEECPPPDLNAPGTINNILLSNARCFSDDEVDLLMLIRNTTPPEMNTTITKTFTAENDSLLFITGKVLDEKNNPASSKLLTLFSNSGSEVFVTDTTNNDGQFSFAVSHYNDSTHFAIEAKNANGKSMKINVKRNPIVFPRFSTPGTLKRSLPEPVFSAKYRQAYFDTAFSTSYKTLPPVTLTDKKEANYNKSRRVSSSSVILTSAQLNERNSVGNAVLQIGGLHMLNGFLVINGLTAMKAPDGTSEPLLLIDGAEAPNVGVSPGDASPVMAALNSLNPKEIDFIEILKGAEGANYGVRGGNGVILVNMSTIPRDNFTSSTGNLQTFYARGISRSVPFPPPQLR